MGAEDLRKHVDERLEYIRKELLDIAEGIPEGPLKERVSNLTGEIEKLVYETLSEVPTTSEEQQKESSGFDGVDHRSNQASYGGVPELFMNNMEPAIHKHTVSFGGIRQLFDVEMEVFGVEEADGGANGHVSRSPSLSPSYEGVDRLFMDGPLQGKENFNGVSDMFEKGGEKRDKGTLQNYGEKRKNMGKEFDPTGRNHDRNVSLGGVRQLAGIQVEDEDLFENQESKDASNQETPAGLIVSDAHNRTASIGGARQLVTMECDSLSEEDEQETSPQVSNNVDQGKDLGHERTVSVGGVRQINPDGYEEEDLGLDGSANELQVDLEDDQSDAAEAEEATGRNSPVAEDSNPVDDLGKHGRGVSQGGVRTLQDFDLGLDELGGNLEGKPRELFDGQGTVEDPRGHERRRSNLQDGRELFEDRNAEKGGTFDQLRGDSYLEMGKSHPQDDGMMKIQDLKREHLQLKMSKIELIKSTAEEIDRLRGIIKTLAIQLRHINQDHNKLLNATLGGQMLDSVSGVFGAFTGFFSAAPEPSSVHRNRN